jgi:quercetin dioxygenase-like cupin family protein
MTSSEFAVETVVRPDGPRGAERVHPRLDTHLRVTDGVVCVAAGEHDHILTPGDSVVIPAGVAHRAWNAGDDEARYVETFRTADDEVRRAARALCPESVAV